MTSYQIKVPASSANIGPGFDVLGIGLNLYLTINVEIDPAKYKTDDENNCLMTYDGTGAEGVPLSADQNLVTRSALMVLRANGIDKFPLGTKVAVHNTIPLSRGLGSSGTAVVGGVLLANAIGQFGFSKQRCLDYCLMIERHPDNITASMLGGFVGSFLRELTPEESAIVHQPLDKVLPSRTNTSVPAKAPLGLGKSVRYAWNRQIKCIAIVPQFEVSTAKSRSVLPENYTRPDIVFNLQRLAVLTAAVGAETPDPALIYPGMQDKLHQPYRSVLIPGLKDVLTEFTPDAYPGLLGICLSGAGPTILALATDNFDHIAESVVARFAKENVECKWLLLEPAYDGATVTAGNASNARTI